MERVVRQLAIGSRQSGAARKTDRPSGLLARPAGAPGGIADETAREAKEDSLDSRYRAAEGFEEMLFVEPDRAARDEYARVTPMHYLAVLAALWLSIAAAAWLLLDMIARWWP